MADETTGAGATPPEQTPGESASAGASGGGGGESAPQKPAGADPAGAVEAAADAVERLKSNVGSSAPAPNPAAAAMSDKASAALAAARAAVAAVKSGVSAMPATPAMTESGAGSESGAAFPAPMPVLQSDGAARMPEDLELLSDVNLHVKIELGRTRMLVEDVLRLGEGSVVELDKLAGDPVDVYVNDRHIARGEVLVLNDNFCVRISEIVDGGDPGEM